MCLISDTLLKIYCFIWKTFECKAWEERRANIEKLQIDFTLWNRKLVSSEQQLEKQNASICRLNCHFVVFSFTTLLLALECVICFTPPWLCFDSFSQQLLGSFKNLFLALKLKFIFLLTHITLFQTFIFSPKKIQLHEGIVNLLFWTQFEQS